MFLSCQQPLTATSVTASKENCIHPISSKFLFLPYLQALSNCSGYLPYGNWKCLGTDQRSHQASISHQTGLSIPLLTFLYLMVQCLHFQTQDSWVPPTDRSFSFPTSPILMPLMSECYLLQNLWHFCTASRQYHSKKSWKGTSLSWDLPLCFSHLYSSARHFLHHNSKISEQASFSTHRSVSCGARSMLSVILSQLDFALQYQPEITPETAQDF